MTRLFVLVEGQSEETFVKSVLAPHLAGFGLEVRALVVTTSRELHGRKHKGGGGWTQWLRDLKRLTGEQDGRFTTMFDLYGLPDDFPHLTECASIADTVKRAAELEAAMAKAADDWRLIPYLQRHEFESLVLALLDPLAELLEDEELKGLQALRQDIGSAGPEDINDGPDTAPSKRIQRFIPSYRKTVHGPLALESGGLATLRQQCPRFGEWLTRLERLGKTT